MYKNQPRHSVHDRRSQQSKHINPRTVRRRYAFRALLISSAFVAGILGILGGASSSAPAPTFAAPAFYTTGAQPYSVAEYVQPFCCGNSAPALAVANNASDSVSLFTGGSGTYSLFFTVSLTPGSDVHEIVASPGSFTRFLAVAASGINAVTVFNPDALSPVNYPVGAYPESIAVGDFNLDNTPDIATSNFGDGTVSVLLGAGFVTFQNAVSYPAGPGPEDIVSADFNADGKPDLATCNSGDNKARVLIGNGDGTFKPAVTYNVGNTPYFLTTADFDGNGKPDLAVANHVSNDVSVLLNTGDGTFQPVVNYPAGVGIYSLSAGDFDLDGTKDLVVASREDNTIRVLINVGNGTFQAPLSFPSGAHPNSALAGDFNGDGRPDVVVANNTASSIGVILNQTAPPNDNFENARVISGASGTTTGANGGASKQFGEPNHAGNTGGKSIWFRYQPPSEGVATIDTLNSLFDTTLAVYTGSSVDSLTPVASNDDAQGRISRVVFRAHANTTYQIAVDGFAVNGGAPQGFVALNWSLGSLLPNDDFDTAQVLSGESGTVTSTNVGASKELGEPNHGGPGERSVWYRWQANSNGRMTFTTDGSDFNTLLAVYTGSSVTSLTPVAANDNIGFCFTSSVTFEVSAGTTYHVAVDGSGGLPTGAITLKWGPPPANDDFEHFTLMPGDSGTVGGTTELASTEPGEPHQSNNGRSVWYRWQPQANGAATVAVSAGRTLFVYTGATLQSLVLINDGFSNTANFTVTSGNTYQIAIKSGCGLSSGPFSLNWNVQPPPSNDLFENATPITQESGVQNGSNIGASKESGEENHAGNPGGGSIWYSWQAPSGGSFTFTTHGSDFDTLLAVYTGNSVNALSTVISSNDDPELSCNPTRSRVTFTAQSGTTYRIAVDGANGAFGNSVLRWGRSASISGSGPAIVDLFGGLCLRRTVGSFGGFAFQNVPTGAAYSLGASEGGGSSASFTMYGAVGSLSPLTGDVTGVKFMQTTPVYGASGFVVVNNGTRDGVGISCANTLVNDFPNDVRPATYSATTGNWSVGGLWIGSSYTCTAQKQGFTFNSILVSGGNAGGTFTGSPVAVSIKLETNPAGLMVSVDGEAPAPAPLTRQWIPGSSHTISTSSPQSGTAGTQYVFSNWTDNGAISHTITVPTSDTTYTANFTTQFRLTMNAGAGGAVGPTTGFFNSGQSAQITATPNNGFRFTGWTGTGTGSFTGNTNPVNVTMNGPITQTASFSQNAVGITIQTNPAGRTISIDGGAPVTAPQQVMWVPGSSHSIATTSPQAGTAGTQFVFKDWSDGGAISHSVTTPTTNTTYTANFTTQHLLTITAGTGGTVSPTTAFFNSGQSIQITATPNSEYIFKEWTGSGAGSFSGSVNPATVTINGPITQTATFLSPTDLRLIIENPGPMPNQVLALESTSWWRDPFSVLTPLVWPNLSDRNTRLVIFLQNFELVAGEPPGAVEVNIVGSNNKVFNVPAQEVLALGGDTRLTQVIFRLPSDLSVGTCVIKVKTHGATTNSGTLRIKQ